MKYTPGPWKLNGILSKVLSNDELELEICILGINENSDNFSFEEYKANGELIARAPELLEENESLKAINKQLSIDLQEAIDQIRHMIDNRDNFSIASAQITMERFSITIAKSKL